MAWVAVLLAVLFNSASDDVEVHVLSASPGARRSLFASPRSGCSGRPLCDTPCCLRWEFPRDNAWPTPRCPEGTVGARPLSDIKHFRHVGGGEEEEEEVCRRREGPERGWIGW